MLGVIREEEEEEEEEEGGDTLSWCGTHQEQIAVGS